MDEGKHSTDDLYGTENLVVDFQNMIPLELSLVDNTSAASSMCIRLGCLSI